MSAFGIYDKYYKEPYESAHLYIPNGAYFRKIMTNYFSITNFSDEIQFDTEKLKILKIVRIIEGFKTKNQTLNFALVLKNMDEPNKAIIEKIINEVYDKNTLPNDILTTMKNNWIYIFAYLISKVKNKNIMIRLLKSTPIDYEKPFNSFFSFNDKKILPEVESYSVIDIPDTKYNKNLDIFFDTYA
jgi:hypothetical protein